MNDCILPPALTPAQLAAAVDGDAELSVQLHLAACPACRGRADALAAAQSRLRTLLRRSTCPAPEQLRDYAWDLLPEDQAAAVAHHAGACPHCTYDLFHTFYTGDTTGDDLFTQAARRLYAAPPHAEYYGAASLASAPAARQRFFAAGAEPQLFDAGAGVLISLVAVPDEKQADRWALEGAVSGLDTCAMQVNLWRIARAPAPAPDQSPNPAPVRPPDQLAATARLDAGGDFRLGGLAAGAYHLIAHTPAAKFWLGPFTVGPAPAHAGETASP
jgi:hypothetical protein